MTSFVDVLAAKLKSIESIKAPEWLFFVKSGSHNERLPSDPDFWFKRCASVLQTMYYKPVGVRRLQHKYGGRHQHLVGRSHHRPAGGKIIRTAIQQLEKAGFLKKEKIGRSISTDGRALVEKTLTEFKA